MRKRRAWKQVLTMMNDIYEKEYDPGTDSWFYVNKVTIKCLSGCGLEYYSIKLLLLWFNRSNKGRKQQKLQMAPMFVSASTYFSLSFTLLEISPKSCPSEQPTGPPCWVQIPYTICAWPSTDKNQIAPCHRPNTSCAYNAPTLNLARDKRKQSECVALNSS